MDRGGEESGQEMMSKVGAAFIRHSTSYSVRRLTVTDRLPATRPRRALLADRPARRCVDDDDSLALLVAALLKVLRFGLALIHVE